MYKLYSSLWFHTRNTAVDVREMKKRKLDPLIITVVVSLSSAGNIL